MTMLGRVIAFLYADTSRDFVTLTLTFWTWTVAVHGGSRDQPCYPTPITSWFMSHNVSRWLCVRGHCACAESREPWVGSQKQLHIWNPRPRLAYSLYNFYWATTTIKGRLLLSRPMLKPFTGEKIQSHRNGAHKWRFWGKWRSKP